jgi:hypothetical protein
MTIHRTLLVITGAAALCACDRTNSRTTEQAPTAEAPAAARIPSEALIRVIQAHPAAPQADVYSGDQKTFAGVGFGTVTPYKSVPNELNLVFKPAGQADGLAMMETKSGIEAGRRYTVLAQPDRDYAAKVDVMTDDVHAPSPGKAMVRLVHVDPEAGAATVFGADRSGDPVVSDVLYGAPAQYKEVPAAEIEVRVAAKPMHPAVGKDQHSPTLVETVQLEAGKAYTLIVTPGDQPGQPVKMLKVEDPIEPAPATGKQNAIQRESETSTDGVYKK